MYVWEKALKMIIKDKRTLELKYKSIVSAIRIFYLSFRDSINKAFIIITLFICVYDEKHLTSDIEIALFFKTMILMHIMEWNIFVNGIWGISKVQASLNSIKGFQRIMNFKVPYPQEQPRQTNVENKQSYSIFLEELNTVKGHYKCLTEEELDEIKLEEDQEEIYDFEGQEIYNINLEIKPRQFVYITGHCNSGKVLNLFDNFILILKFFFEIIFFFENSLIY